MNSTGGQPAPDRARLASVDALRGLAALSVCVFHFTCADVSPLKHLATSLLLTGYGWLGVQAFFVISGFVVPLAMSRSGYRLRRFGTFMVKRLVRLDPPYLATVAIIVLLNQMSMPTIEPVAHRWPSLTQTVGHLLYGVSHFFLAFTWLNSVFWTLEVEFQYYVLIALVFPLLFAPKAWIRIATLVVFAAASLTNAGSLHWLSVFGVGVTLCLMTTDRLTRAQGVGILTMFAVVAWLTVGVAVTLVALSTVAAIQWWRSPQAPVKWLGKISFSLYLLHIPIGGRVLAAIAGPNAGTLAGLVAIVAALGASIAAAWLLWLAVEQPSQRLASRIRYRITPALDAPRGAFQHSVL